MRVDSLLNGMRALICRSFVTRGGLGRDDFSAIWPSGVGVGWRGGLSVPEVATCFGQIDSQHQIWIGQIVALVDGFGAHRLTRLSPLARISASSNLNV
ncbi:unnamed protein product [Dibothriocephalus latus]|uniref:Uncharacterized protein n=1 Tax=Dibothriocephalus latus TaxID=60516 RepID=A0A3P7LJ76_DIBLA|nr:unnamed protein product [Dibothriocephalus latus]